MSSRILQTISDFLGERIISSEFMGGGCIAQSGKIITDTGKSFFLKQGYNNGMFDCESNGLNEIAKSNSIQTPKVILVDKEFLLLGINSNRYKEYFIYEGIWKQLCQDAQIYIS